MARTGCECPLAGYCNRHGVEKTPHEHMQCKHNPTWFKKWEDGKMPGQDKCKIKAKQIEEKEKEEEAKPYKCQFCGDGKCTGECRNQNQLPSKWQMAKNLAGAMKDAAKDGFSTEGEDEVQRRLAICEECPLFLPAERRCSVCGCAMNFKAKLRSQHCPEGKW